MQFDSRQLAALSAILRLGSFEAAAGALGITQSAVSQRLKALEEQVGTILVLRESPCRGTDAGRRLAAHAEAVALLETQTSADLGRGEDGGVGPARIRIAVNADSLATWLLGGLSKVDNALYELVVDDEAHSGDWLRRGEVLAAVSQQSRPVQGCDVHELGALRYIATASPGFVDRWFADGLSAKTLARAPMLRFDAKDALQNDWLTRNFRSGINPPTHIMPSPQAFVESARRGLGWGLNPEPMVRRLIRRGVLVPLGEGIATLDKPLYWQVSRMMGTLLDPVTEAVKTRARSVLQQGVSDKG